MVNKCGLIKEVNAKSWLVQLSIGTKGRVHHFVRSCTFELNGMTLSTHIRNGFPLGSYNMLLSMELLFTHRTMIDCYEKEIEFPDDYGERRILQGKKRPTLVRIVTTMKAKCSIRKRCVLFAVHISNEKWNDVQDDEVLRRYPILQKFQDMFPVEILELPRHEQVYFYI